MENVMHFLFFVGLQLDLPFERTKGLFRCEVLTSAAQVECKGVSSSSRQLSSVCQLKVRQCYGGWMETSIGSASVKGTSQLQCLCDLMLGSYTSMCKCIMWFVFLLQLTLCSLCKADAVEELVKTIGRETDLTPACRNITQDLIVFVTCRIRPVRSGGEDCILSFLQKKGFNVTQGCDPRFSLILINQTVFLQMKNLQPENSGNYSCSCVVHGGTLNLHLNITVEDNVNNTNSTVTSTVHTDVFYVIGAVVLFVILLGAITGFICRKKCNRRRRREVTITVQPNTVLYTEVEDIDPYRIFKENELYLTSVIHTSTSTRSLIGIGMDNPSPVTTL
ncbi:uncharacterized protein LOC119792326 [Cyprinodon tularosa]|uniref:uncharacterized protein LOC119792326 n=1 Tax=Cyprinodon tularosa TaxID=77115 RepID=UPI0018E276C6|nr:uncharacterized protein LOC119792326 [Cyprinodon tularosa]